jgi:hypothetical protein
VLDELPELCDCRAANRLCRNVPNASAEVVEEVPELSLLDVVEDVLLVELVPESEAVDDALLAPRILDKPPVIPKDLSALSIAPNNPPPSLP